jgi:putative Mg2+ transporter-C (MgtC) family protein
VNEVDLTAWLRLELLAQLALSVLLGGAVGLQRELKGKPAGLRTNILICIGATLFTTLSYRMAGGRGDPGRVAAQILTGVGFLGAGTILHTRAAVVGLTSAATIWVVAAIGMALGSAAYVEAIGTTILVLVVLEGLERLELLVARRYGTSRLKVRLRPEETALQELDAVVRGHGLEVTRSASRREGEDLVVDLDIHGPRRQHDQLLSQLVRHPLVRGVSTGE